MYLWLVVRVALVVLIVSVPKLSIRYVMIMPASFIEAGLFNKEAVYEYFIQSIRYL